MNTMKVVVRMVDLETACPDLIPGIRAGGSVPAELVVEARLTVDEVAEKELREKFPEYWNTLSRTEWRVFQQLYTERECSRGTLRTLMLGNVTDVDDDGMYSGSNVVDVHIRNLRPKLRGLGGRYRIASRRGWGYALETVDDACETTVLGVKAVVDDRKSVGERSYKPRADRLNAVEFGYLKELKMDDYSIEDAAAKLKKDVDNIRMAWNSRTFMQYEQRSGFRIARYRVERSRRACSLCGESGHNRRRCPNKQ